MANTKNYTEHGGSVTHIGGELVLDPGSKIIKDGQEIDIGGGGGTFDVEISLNDTRDGYVTNKTIKEVASAYKSGMIVRMIDKVNVPLISILQLTSVGFMESEEGEMIMLNFSASTMNVTGIIIDVMWQSLGTEEQIVYTNKNFSVS